MGTPCRVVDDNDTVKPAVPFRRLTRAELLRVAEIDRTERIDLRYEQRGVELFALQGAWHAEPWDPNGLGSHSVAAQLKVLVRYADAGGIAIGAFADEALVAIGVVVPHLRPQIAQLAYLHVSNPFRASGIGTRLAEQLEQIARTAGDTTMVVTATPSQNTVRFYLGCGFEVVGDPLPELFEQEPDDVHVRKLL